MAQDDDGDGLFQVARQQAAEMILGSLSLTDKPTDMAARPLLQWGLGEAEALAADLASRPGLDVPGATDLLTQQIRPVCRVMKVVSSLVADRRRLEPDQVAEELALVLDLTDRLSQTPACQAAGVRSSALADLAAWQTEMDDNTFVRSVVALLQAPGADSDDGREPAGNHH